MPEQEFQLTPPDESTPMKHGVERAEWEKRFRDHFRKALWHD